jgi:hypothetical protein
VAFGSERRNVHAAVPWYVEAMLDIPFSVRASGKRVVACLVPYLNPCPMSLIV